jgi:Fic family protein
MTSHNWKPIEDLDDSWALLASPDIASISRIWLAQRNELSSTAIMKDFLEKLKREWAIETGILEGLYSIDRGITILMIEQGLDAALIPHGSTDKSVDEIMPLIKDQQAVIEGLFDFVGGARDLSTAYIKELHAVLTANQGEIDAMDQFGNVVKTALISGKYKTTPNNPKRFDGEMHEYCPPEQVDSEMDNLIQMHYEHIKIGIPPEIEAAWLHHRFTQIHPFQDGNGRVARALATLVFLKAGWLPLVVVSEEHRVDYIRSLEAADHGDLKPLVDLFVKIETKSIIKALSLAQDVVLGQQTIAKLLDIVSEKFSERKQVSSDAQLLVSNLSQKLEEYASAQFVTLAKAIQDALQKRDISIYTSVERSDYEKKLWFRNQIIDIARELGYYADLRTYHGWVRLKLYEELKTDVVLSFHSVGTRPIGMFTVIAFQQTRHEDEEVGVVMPHLLGSEQFSFTYLDDHTALIARFDIWLKNIIVLALDRWQKQS